MKVRLPKASCLAFVAYGMSLLTPIAHSWLHDRSHSCSQCPTHHGKAELDTGCDGNCNDPTHHHGEPYHTGQCVLCNTPRTFQTPPTIYHGTLALVLEGPFVPVPLLQIHCPADPGPVPIRGPPIAIHS